MKCPSPSGNYKSQCIIPSRFFSLLSYNADAWSAETGPQSWDAIINQQRNHHWLHSDTMSMCRSIIQMLFMLLKYREAICCCSIIKLTMTDANTSGLHKTSLWPFLWFAIWVNYFSSFFCPCLNVSFCHKLSSFGSSSKRLWETSIRRKLLQHTIVATAMKP